MHFSQALVGILFGIGTRPGIFLVSHIDIRIICSLIRKALQMTGSANCFRQVELPTELKRSFG